MIAEKNYLTCLYKKTPTHPEKAYSGPIVAVNDARRTVTIIADWVDTQPIYKQLCLAKMAQFKVMTVAMYNDMYGEDGQAIADWSFKNA